MIIQTDTINLFFKEILTLINKVSEQVEGVNETIKEKNRQFESKVEIPAVVQEKIETLRMSDLTSVVRAYMPKNANAVAACYSKPKDAYRLTLTFLNGKEILPKEENKLIVITAEFMSREIENLFDNRSVIILK